MGLHDFTLYDVIERNALCFGQNAAWMEAEDTSVLTFTEIKAQVDHLTAGLQQFGIRKGDRIGILSQNCLHFFLLYGAAAATGAIVLPINWRLSTDEIAFILKDGAPKFLFVDPRYEGLIDDIKSKLDFVEQFFNVNSDGTLQPFRTLMDHSHLPAAVNVASDDGWIIIHTAAVEGRPRGALLSHGNVLCTNLHYDHYFHIHPGDAHLNLLPLFHVAGLFTATAGFHFGAVNINMRKFDAEQAVALIENQARVFIFDFSPVLGSILEAHEKTGRDIRPLQAVVGLDTPETIEKYQALTGGTFFCMYGQTETACLATMAPYDQCPGSAGRPLPLVSVRLVDDNEQTVTTDQVGEITVRGPAVFKGYWNLEADNAVTFRNGWHHTGDTGRFDENGFLWYAGRKAEKELIKPGGENVYPAEVEKVILEHPAVEQTVVFGVPDPKWKEGIKAVCLLKEGQTLDARQLIDFVGDRIARYKKPQYVEFITEWPVLANGETDRKKIKARHGGDQE